MPYYLLEPYTAGDIGSGTVGDLTARPPRIEKLEYEVVEWIGDDIVSGLGCVLVTERLKQRLESIGATGCVFDHVDITFPKQLDFFRQDDGSVSLKGFDVLDGVCWLKLTGFLGVDDFAPAPQGSIYELVVSQRVLDILQSLQFNHCNTVVYREKDL